MARIAARASLPGRHCRGYNYLLPFRRKWVSSCKGPQSGAVFRHRALGLADL